MNILLFITFAANSTIQEKSNKSVSIKSNSTFSSAYQFFLWGSAFFVLTNLLIMNDWMALWEPWEKGNLAIIFAEDTQRLNLPQGVLGLFELGEKHNVFLLRLVGVLVFLLGLGVSYWIGKPIFGKRNILNGGLVLTTSFAILFCTKLVVNDIWLLTAQLIALFAMLRYMKQPSLKWLLLFWGLAIVGILIHPWSMAIAIFVLGGFLRFVHPEGKRLDKLFYWLLPVVLFFTPYHYSGFIFCYGDMPYWKYLGLMFLGFLPWTGFLVASFADLNYKFRKGEEMAIIISGILLAGLASQSLLLVVALALMIARQLFAYFQKNYPYRSIARGFAVLQLLFSFFLITYLLLNAYTTIGAVGFRAIMATGAVYWILTFIGVIGLFGDQKRLIMVGMVWGALTSFFLLLVRTYPMLYPIWNG